jgi:hypothetical protein
MVRFLIALALVLPFALSGTACRSHDHDHADVVVCEHCGMEAGSVKCCDPSSTRCADCGMIAGSPGCCVK